MSRPDSVQRIRGQALQIQPGLAHHTAMTTRDGSHEPWLISASPPSADIVVAVLVPVCWRPVFHQLCWGGPPTHLPVTCPPLPYQGKSRAEHGALKSSLYIRVNRVVLVLPPALIMARLLTAMHMRVPCDGKESKKKKDSQEQH